VRCCKASATFTRTCPSLGSAQLHVLVHGSRIWLDHCGHHRRVRVPPSVCAVSGTSSSRALVGEDMNFKPEKVGRASKRAVSKHSSLCSFRVSQRLRRRVFAIASDCVVKRVNSTSCTAKMPGKASSLLLNSSRAIWLCQSCLYTSVLGMWCLKRLIATLGLVSLLKLATVWSIASNMPITYPRSMLARKWGSFASLGWAKYS
jgi:hypothetical protein